jgi:hypothetical protein
MNVRACERKREKEKLRAKRKSFSSGNTPTHGIFMNECSKFSVISESQSRSDEKIESSKKILVRITRSSESLKPVKDFVTHFRRVAKHCEFKRQIKRNEKN